MDTPLTRYTGKERGNGDGKSELRSTKVLKINNLLIRPIYSKAWCVAFRSRFKFLVVLFKKVTHAEVR